MCTFQSIGWLWMEEDELQIMLCGSANRTLEKNVVNGISFHLIEPSLLCACVCFFKVKIRSKRDVVCLTWLKSCECWIMLLYSAQCTKRFQCFALEGTTLLLFSQLIIAVFFLFQTKGDATHTERVRLSTDRKRSSEKSSNFIPLSWNDCAAFRVYLLFSRRKKCYCNRECIGKHSNTQRWWRCNRSM